MDARAREERMRRWRGWGAVLLVLLVAGGLVRAFMASGGGTSASGASRAGASVRGPVNALLTAPVAPARGSLAIRGKVVGPRGPVAGAVVVATVAEPEVPLAELPCDCGEGCETKLLDLACGTRAAQLVELVARRYGEAPPRARATTDAEGRFSLEGLEAGAHEVWAEGTPGTGLVEDVAAGREGVEVRLGDGPRVMGTVRDEEGAPVAGALVTALHQRHSRYFEGVTGADGRFRLGPLPAGQLLLVFSRPDLLPDFRYVGRDFEPELEMTLYRPRRLGGRVVRGEAPVAGVTVHARGERRDWDTLTDGEGRFAFDGLPPGSYSLTASHEGQDAVAEARLEPGEEPPELELSLGSGVWLRGTVRDDRGRPIPGARVGLLTDSRALGEDMKSVEAGADGAYALGPLEPGRYHLLAGARRFVDALPQEHDVDGVTPVHFVLKDAVVVEGRVVDAEGRPVKQARLLLKKGDDGQDFPDDYEPELEQVPQARGFSEDDGTFLLEAPEAGAWFLRGFHADHVTAGLPVSAPRSDVRLVLEAGAEIQGEVVDELGAPVPDADVFLTLKEQGEEPNREKWATPDARGCFTLRGVFEGTYLISATVLSSREHRRAIRVLEVQGRSPLHVRLQFPRGERVSGVVVDAEGRPLPGAVVEVGQTPERRRAASEASPDDVAAEYLRAPSRVPVGEEGHFTVPHLEPGPWSLSVSLEGYRLDASASQGGASRESGTVLRVQAGEEAVRLVMRRMAAIRGRVVREDGSSIRRFELNGWDITDSEGAFLTPVHRTGDVTLTFMAKGLAGTTRTVRVEEDQQVDLGTVVLKKGRQVHGHVTDAMTGAPVEGALVDVGDVPGDPEGWQRPAQLSEQSGAVRTGSDGTFTLPHVEDRPHALVVVHPDFLQKRVLLGAHQDAVAVALDAGVIIRGTVRGGGPGALYVQIAAEAQGSIGQAGVHEGGVFEKRRLAAGSYVLSVERWDVESAKDAPVFLPRRVQVPAQGVVTVDFEPRETGATVHLKQGGPPPGDATAFLVPGQVAMPGSRDELERSFLMGSFAQRGPEGWTFRFMPPGPYTAFILDRTNRRLRVLREELMIPEEGALTRELAPRWHTLEAPAMSAEEP
jgi:protocatechuate 3,4-dioxygenase beta subunit